MEILSNVKCIFFKPGDTRHIKNISNQLNKKCFVSVETSIKMILYQGQWNPSKCRCAGSMWKFKFLTKLGLYERQIPKICVWIYVKVQIFG